MRDGQGDLDAGKLEEVDHQGHVMRIGDRRGQGLHRLRSQDYGGRLRRSQELNCVETKGLVNREICRRNQRQLCFNIY